MCDSQHARLAEPLGKRCPQCQFARAPRLTGDCAPDGHVGRRTQSPGAVDIGRVGSQTRQVEDLEVPQRLDRDADFDAFDLIEARSGRCMGGQQVGRPIGGAGLDERHGRVAHENGRACVAHDVRRQQRALQQMVGQGRLAAVRLAEQYNPGRALHAGLDPLQQPGGPAAALDGYASLDQELAYSPKTSQKIDRKAGRRHHRTHCLTRIFKRRDTAPCARISRPEGTGPSATRTSGRDCVRPAAIAVRGRSARPHHPTFAAR